MLRGMPRKPRLDCPGLLHHVIARGIERRPIFLSKIDYEDFLNRMSTVMEKSTAQCLSWALMPNHVHMLIRSGREGVAFLMRRLLTGYAVSFNHRHRRAGHLFQNRYKSIVCQEDSYLMELVRYIHLNPLRAGIVKNMESLGKYPWTGHAVLMGNKDAKWQEVKEVLEQHGGSRKRYEEFVQDGIKRGRRPDLVGGGLIRSLGGIRHTQTIRFEDRQAYDERILGDGDFVEGLLKGEETDGKRSVKKSWTLEMLMEMVSRIMGVRREELTMKTRRRTVSKGKAALICLGVDVLGKSGREMERLTHMSSAAVSQALQRGRDLVKNACWRQELNILDT